MTDLIERLYEHSHYLKLAFRDQTRSKDVKAAADALATQSAEIARLTAEVAITGRLLQEEAKAHLLTLSRAEAADKKE